MRPSDEELANLERAKNFSNESRKDADRFYLGETSHYNPQTEKWEPEAKSSNEETPKSRTSPNVTTDGVQTITVAGAQPPQLQSTSFNISNFRSEIERNGVLPQNRFLVVVTRPKTLSAYYTTDFLTMRCDSASIPGVNFFTTNVNRYGHGQTERRPYLPVFNAVSLKFIVDKKSSVVGFFNAWTNSIVNYDVSKGMYASNGRNSPYELTYKDDYICPQLQIYVYDYTNTKQIKVTLFDAYPIATTDMDLSWTESNDVMRYQISLQFTHMTMEAVEGNAFDYSFAENGKTKAIPSVTTLGKDVNTFEDLKNIKNPFDFRQDVIQNTKTSIV
jgi:hypothetical protein